MIKTQKRLVALIVCLVMVMSFTACQIQSGGDTTYKKSYYSVTYNLNYAGAAENRVESYQAGATAYNWQAPRDGFKISGWYTDAECTEKFDFSKPLEQDVVLYAGWGPQPGMVKVTFDFGYSGGANKEVAIKDGSTINKKHAPTINRYGADFNGWFTDTDFTKEWDFETDTVDGDTTLYAKFTQTINVAKDKDGNIIYNNIVINLHNRITGVLPQSTLQKVVDVFNKEYEGKIKVNLTSGTIGDNQKNVFLRIQQSIDMMKDGSTYYPIGDIYSLADIDIKNDDFLVGALNESTSAGVMLHTPIGAIAPYIVYNKALMEKYSPNGLPTTFSELSAVLQAAAKGEAANKSFKSILTTSDDHFNQYLSMIAFSQNNADYFTYSYPKVTSLWNDEAYLNRAVTAMENTYDLFGVNGANGGSATATNTSAIYTAVKGSNALMGIMSWYGDESSVAKDETVGVMPLNGLFTDSTDEASKRVPVYTFGIGFYNGAENVLADPLKICASAVLTNWISEHDYLFAQYGYMPMRRSSYENEEYVNSQNATVSLLKQAVGSPENFWTLSGWNKAYTVIPTGASKNTIVAYLNSTSGKKSDAKTKVESIYAEVLDKLS